MAHKDQIQLLEYWRNTLADGSRVEIKVDKTIHLHNLPIDYAKGYVPSASATTLLDAVEKKQNEAKGRSNQNDPDWEKLEETSILIAPFRVSPDPEYTKYSGETGISYPFWIRALLNRNGFLKPDEDTFPYIPRTHLEPQVNEAVNFIFSDVDKIDNAFARPFAGEEKWTEYWTYIQDCFQLITGMQLQEYVSENHTVSFSNTIVAHENLTAAADGIIRLYDYLIREKKVPPLLEKLADRSNTQLKSLLTTNHFEDTSATHLGQMAHTYPLSISQRKSLYHFQTLQKGEVLAVNGPPGTGKTTLLQSIVANEVVQSAVKGHDPAVIIACSTNNQAVTNIIDSFFSVTQKPGLLYERWLPNLKGFGLYLPAQSKIVSGDIPHLKRVEGRLSGAHTDKENYNYLDIAEQTYIEKSQRYLQQEGLNVLNITKQLQATLQHKQKELQEGIKLWQQYKTIPVLLQKLGATTTCSLFSGQKLDEKTLDQIQANIKDIERKLSDYLDQESFWIKLFSFLRFVKEKRAIRLKQLFRDCPVNYDTVNFYKISSFHHFFDEKLQVIQQIKKLSQAWKNWKQNNNIKSNPPIDDEGFKMAEHKKETYFYDELEMGLKYDLFYLAIHYWEGRWIMATKDLILEDRVYKNGERDAQKRWQRFAMLSPCFVSTFFMAPKFFSYSKLVKTTGSRSVWDTPPLLDYIDLLIVDEAGQVSPEVGAATFALAKKALVVGDTLQIEPVWNVPAKVDHANLHRYKVITNINDQKSIADLQSKGFLSSACSMMQLAQKTTPYQLYPEMERGMMLTEHRRCFDEIIEYCNRLAYHGLLEPKKGSAKNSPFAPMQFHAVSGISVIRGGSSRANSEEAAAIAQWILANQEQLLNHYQDIENTTAAKEKRPQKTLRLADIVGIITPFTGQKHELALTLRRAGINLSGLTIGTVHALQGAERPVVLFSSTYGTNDLGKSYFYDRGVNMLNVAVSRAKDVFILFGCKEILSQNATTPSGQLYRYIEKKTSVT